MEVTLQKRLRAVPPGEIHPRTFKAGEAVSGRLAEIAVAVGAAPAKATAPTNNKATAPKANK